MVKTYVYQQHLDAYWSAHNFVLYPFLGKIDCLNYFAMETNPYEFELLYLKFARGIFLANDNLELKYKNIKMVKSFTFEKN